MGKSSPNLGKHFTSNVLDSAGYAARSAQFLRQRHPFKPAEAVEYATGGLVTAGQVKKWLLGHSAPSLPALMVLIGVYGPEIIGAIMGSVPGWLDAAARADRLSRLGGDLAALSSEIDALEVEP